MSTASLALTLLCFAAPQTEPTDQPLSSTPADAENASEAAPPEDPSSQPVEPQAPQRDETGDAAEPGEASGADGPDVDEAVQPNNEVRVPSAQLPGPSEQTARSRMVIERSKTLKGEVLTNAISFYAKGARRDRYVRAGVNLGLSGVVIGLGVYARQLDRGEGLRRTALTQIVTGGISATVSIVDLALRSPIERLQRSPDFTVLSTDFGNRDVADRVEASWRKAAKRARTRRLVLGGVTTFVGAGLTTVGAVQLGQADSDTPNDERLWAYTTLLTGLGAVTSGVVSLLLPGEDERSFSAYEAGLTPLRQRFVRVTPSFGGLSISGRY